MMGVKVATVLLLACFLAQGESQKVTVSLYYESLCPACKSFVSRGLYPAYQKIGDYVDVVLVPYGNAHRRLVNGQYQISCQHGERECYGNKQQACVVASNATQTQKVNFVGCVASASDPTAQSVIEKCAAANSLNASNILKCASGAEGNKLLEKYGEITDALKPAHQYTPWILLNGVHNDSVQAEAEEDLAGAVCRRLTTKPAVCRQ